MRINIIPVQELYDQHLVAEYREIKMLPKALVRSIKSKQGLDITKIPSQYTLNKGHGYFFYNKLKFIEKRFSELITEMHSRGFTTNFVNLYDVDFDYSCIHTFGHNLFNDYSPSEIEKDVNVTRIKLRYSEKQNFYKYKGILC